MKKYDDAPKILPWLAKKAGISDDRLRTLWRLSQDHARKLTGETETPAFWKAAVDRLLELTAAEALRADLASFGWRHWTRWYARWWQVSVVT